jgi:hypothetical protein
MKRLISIPGTTLVAMAVVMMVFPVQLMAAGVRIEAPQLASTSASLATDSVPQHGELQIGDRVFSLERVDNGFVARDLTSGETVVITAEEVAQYDITRSPAEGSELPYVVAVERSEEFGGDAALSVQVDEHSGSSFTGSLFHGTQVVPVVYTDLSDDAGVSDGSSEVRLVTGEAVVIVIVLTAAALGVIGCTILGWVTNCIKDCSAACAAAGGRMLSASEGPCGQCTCKCQPLATTGTPTPTGNAVW